MAAASCLTLGFERYVADAQVFNSIAVSMADFSGCRPVGLFSVPWMRLHAHFGRTPALALGHFWFLVSVPFWHGAFAI
jgi:hypothetical protein